MAVGWSSSTVWLPIRSAAAVEHSCPPPTSRSSKVTTAEAATYRDFARDYTTGWGSMDPMVARIQRQPLPDGKFERVSIDIQAAPLAEKHVEMLSKWLGEPTDQRLVTVPGNAVQFEAVVRGGTFFAGGEHHLFGALRDADPAIALDPSAGLIARLFTSQFEGLQGYLGAWPNPGFLRLIGGASNARPDAAGYSQLLTGLWRRQFNDFTLVSFHPQILEQISPQLRFEKAPRPAQVWFRADDLAQLATGRPAQCLRLSPGETSHRRQRPLHEYAQRATARSQDRVPGHGRAAAGGEVCFAARRQIRIARVRRRAQDLGLHGPGRCQKRRARSPDDYRFPALNWLRGVDAELAVVDGRLAAHANVIMPVETRPAAFQLPSLPFGAGKAAGPRPPTGPSPRRRLRNPRRRVRAPGPSVPAPSDAKPRGPQKF